MSGVRIHPTALVDASAELGDGVNVGPFCIVEADTRLGAGTSLESHVVVKSGTRIGEHCRIFVGAVLGHEPQDARFPGEGNHVIIGNHNILREYVTVHRATVAGNDTIIGDHNMLMAYVHIGHDCRLGSHIYIASYSGISGHVTLEDYVNIGGMAGFHQFVHVGRRAMIGGLTKVNTDVPPFMMADGHPMKMIGLNSVGLRRSHMPAAERAALKDCYRLLYRSGLNTAQALERISDEVPRLPAVEELVGFVRRIYEGRAGRQDQGR